MTQHNIPKLRFPEFSIEWQEKTIGETCEIKTGNKDTQNKEGHGMYPFFVRSNTVERINSFVYDGEAILTSGDGVGVGKNFHYIVGKFDYHQRVYCLRKFSNDVSGKFLYFVFAEKFYRRVIALSAKNSVDSVRMDMISDMKINFPSLPEQQKIASFLSAVDKKIEQLRKKKELLEQYKKGMMQKLFSRELRFKDEDGKEFPEWEEKELGEIALKKTSNISANAIEDNFGEYIIYGATGILKYIDFFKEEEEYISIIKDGAGVGRLFICAAKSSVLGTMDILKPLQGVNIYFLYLVLQQIDFTKYVTGSTIPHIYFKDYSKTTIGMPSITEQTKIAHFLSAIDNKINALGKQFDKAKEFKKGLLQQMFV